MRRCPSWPFTELVDIDVVDEVTKGLNDPEWPANSFVGYPVSYLALLAAIVNKGQGSRRDKIGPVSKID